MRIILSTLITIVVINSSAAQDAKFWNSKKCAVALTYDDALNVHLDNAIPLLDSLNLKATFYLSAYSPGSKNRIGEWRKAALRGHELGNHTLFHPCRGEGRAWVIPERDLDKYSMQRVLEEIRMTNVFLEAIDGKTKRTFAYPCGDMTVQGVSYVDGIKNDFVAARGVESRMFNLAQDKDFFNVGAYGISGESGEEMIALVEKAKATNSLIVFLFHGVGGEHNLNVALSEHKKLLQYLKRNEKEIWVAPFVEVMEYAKKNQK